MKSTIVLGAFLGLAISMCPSAYAKGSGGGGSKGGSHATKGYVKKDGTYVAPHRATNPDGKKSNNWSQKGNVNPYTGKEGTKKD